METVQRHRSYGGGQQTMGEFSKHTPIGVRPVAPQDLKKV